MRREQLAIRAGGSAFVLSAAILLSGCATTVDGRAAAAIRPIAGTTAGAPASAGTTSPSVPATRPAEVDEPATDAADTVADTTDPPDEPVDMTIGDSIIVWDDAGEAELIVRHAAVGADGLLLVTIDYECYDGECPYFVTDWTVTDAAGNTYLPSNASGFGDNDELSGMLAEWTEKRGHLVFDVPPGSLTLEFDARSGDPATWLVPAA